MAIRNIGIFGHAGSGKTTMADAILYLTGGNSRFGKVADKTSMFDTDSEELERGCSLNLGLATFQYNGSTINLIDTPGYADFIGEVASALSVVDCAIMVIDATTGIEATAERFLKMIEEKKLPLIFFINKLKKENANFYNIIPNIKGLIKRTILPLTLPIGKANNFTGIANLINNKGIGIENNKRKEIEIPGEMKQRIEDGKNSIIEASAEIDDALMNKYVEGKEITSNECIGVINHGVIDAKLSPLFAGDALQLIGIHTLIDAITSYLPPYESLPELKIDSNNITRSEDSPFIGYVFKTIAEPHLGELLFSKVLSGKIQTGDVVTNTTRGSNEKINQIYLVKGKERSETNFLTAGMIGAFVRLKNTHTSDTLTQNKKITLPPIKFPAPSISMAIVPKAKGDEDKLSNGLARLHDEDPTFTFSYDPEIKQLLISGIGELHLDVILARLKRKYGVSVVLTKPGIKYRETFAHKSEAQGKYKKQTGGHGQYGDCWLRIEPLSRDSGYEFVNKIVGGAIPTKYIPSVEKGVREALQNGELAGYPITDVRVTCFDGSYHPVDSSDIAFKIAASMALRSAAKKAGINLLEPISEVEVYVPEEFMGDVIGDLNSRRGKIMGMEASGKIQRIKAFVPEAEMFKYSTSLRSITQGRGYFTMKFSHYEGVPKEITQKIVDAAKGGDK